MAEALVRHSKHMFAQKAELGMQHGERSIVAYGTEIAKVIRQSFQFGHERPQPHGALWNVGSKRCLGCPRKGQSVGHGAVAGNPPGEHGGPLN